MFGSLGGPEIILIFVVALIVFGPKRLPEIGRKVGGLVRELRRATGEFRSSVEREIGLDPVEGLDQARKARRDILATVSDPIREVTQGAIAVARDARREAKEALRVEEALEEDRALDGDDAGPSEKVDPPGPSGRTAREGTEHSPAAASEEPSPP